MQTPEDNNQEWMTPDEWKKFTPGTSLDPEISARMLKAVRQNTVGKRRVKRMFATAVSVAACLLLAVAGIRYLTDGLQGPRPLMALQEKVIVNENSASKIITLADRSRVVLYPNSTLVIDSVFNVSKRMLKINGEADFFVEPDSRRPFIVMAGEYATTALGTSFKIIYREQQDNFDVQLMTGKVSVEQQSPTAKKILCYLTPGRQLRLNLRSQQFAVGQTEIKPSVTQQTGTRSIDRRKMNSPSTIEVEKESLAQFLARLSKQFDTIIVFEKKELENMNVTATFKDETLAEILEQIAILNDLSCEKKGPAYVIRRR